MGFALGYIPRIFTTFSRKLSSRELQVNTTYFLTNIFHFLKMYNEKVPDKYENQEKLNWRVILNDNLFDSKLCWNFQCLSEHLSRSVSQKLKCRLKIITCGKTMVN